MNAATASPSLLATLLRTLRRVVLLALGTLFGLLMLTLGLMLALGVVVWALLRGRRPVVRQAFVWPRQAPWRAAPQGEVVDIEAREVGPAAAPPPALRER